MLKKEHRLKLEIIWGNVSKGLENGESFSVKNEIRDLVDMFINSLADFNYQEEELRRQFKESEKLRERDNQEQVQKFMILSELNQQLEKEVQQIKFQTISMIKDKQQKDDFVSIEYQRQNEVIMELKAELQTLTRNNFELESLIEEWELQCKTLQERCGMFDKAIMSKQQQIRVMHQDVKYLRIECQKYKSQKKEFQRLWQRSNIDLREFKIAFQEEVTRSQRQKTKWMNQCQFRRQQSQQIQSIETQKELMAKQIHQIRNNYSLKCKELTQTKTLLHQLQRKIIEVDSDNFRMGNQVEKIRREKEYWETEMSSLKSSLRNIMKQPKEDPEKKQGRKRRNRRSRNKGPLMTSKAQLRTADNMK